MRISVDSCSEWSYHHLGDILKRLQQKDSFSTVDQSLSIVKEWYAKGEITKEQYDQLTKDLKTS